MKHLRWQPSLILCLVLCVAIVFFRFVYPPVSILTWDVFGYYLYLPARFIYHDLRLSDLGWVQEIVDKYQTTGSLYQLYQVEGTSFWVIKESIGLAVLNAPAFFIAHIYSQFAGFTPDGFSLPYQYAFAISGLVYACIGVFMLRKILVQFFDETITTIVLLLVVVGTNHFQLTAFDGYLTHNYLFTLYTLVAWYSLKWHREQKPGQAFGLGLSMGLAVLVRPSEMVCILIPLFWGVYNKESLLLKWQLIRKYWEHLLILVFAMFLGGLPQMLYWKYVAGQWIYYTYQNPGEGLDLWAPYTLKFLFSFRKGWFIYTPVMLLALIGFFHLYRKQRPLFLSLLIYFIMNLWIVSSWTAWWYGGGSFSQRAMLPAYVLMAIPLGFLAKAAMESKLRIPLLGLMAMLLMLNIFQTWQWAHGIIDKTRMSREYYFAIFGKTKVGPEDRNLLLVDKLAEEVIPEDKSGYNYRQLILKDFESGEISGGTLSDTAFSGNYGLKVSPEAPFVAGYEAAYEELTDKDYAWIRVSVSVYPPAGQELPAASLVASFEHKGGVYKYKAESVTDKKYNIQPGKWNTMHFDYITPDIRSVKDRLKIYFWLQGSNPMIIDDLKVELWEPLK